MQWVNNKVGEVGMKYMATKVYCDRCKCEIDINSNGYRKMYFMFGRDDDMEDYDFCEKCFVSVKRSIVKNLLDYERPALDDWTEEERK